MLYNTGMFYMIRASFSCYIMIAKVAYNIKHMLSSRTHTNLPDVLGGTSQQVD